MFIRFLLIFLCINSVTAGAVVKEKPKLVLVLVFDQFRSDSLSRFESRFLPAKKDGKVGGFRYLMEQGAYYPQASHGVLQNMTCPGHAAILTGAYPYQHGIAGNDWYDRELKRKVYCVEDGSPRYLVGSTFGDELKNSGFKSRVVGVSLKDRAAILLGGHRADLAIWMPDDFAKSDEGMRWVSSSYYLHDGKTPKWLNELNEKIGKEKGRLLTWSALGAGSGKTTPGAEVWLPKFVEDLGTGFPHEVKVGTYSSMILPYGVEKTEEAAERAMAAYDLGNGKDTDVLAVSFSQHDFIGHLFGPNSREYEEITVSEDQFVSKLLNSIDRHVKGGLKKTLVVMTADHGASPSPEWMKKSGYRDAFRIDEPAWIKDINEFLNKKYQKPKEGEWIVVSFDLNFYLNRKVLADQKLSTTEVARAVADYLVENKKDNVAYAFTAEDVKKRQLPPALHETQTLRSFVEDRNGDVIVIPKPYQIVGKSATTHLTGYAYDRTVPILLAGERIRPGVYGQAAQVIDIATTLSFLTGVTPPSGSEGRVLTEAIK